MLNTQTLLVLTPPPQPPQEMPPAGRGGALHPGSPLLHADAECQWADAELALLHWTLLHLRVHGHDGGEERRAKGGGGRGAGGSLFFLFHLFSLFSSCFLHPLVSSVPGFILVAVGFIIFILPNSWLFSTFHPSLHCQELWGDDGFNTIVFKNNNSNKKLTRKKWNQIATFCRCAVFPGHWGLCGGVDGGDTQRRWWRRESPPLSLALCSSPRHYCHIVVW